MRSSVTGSDIMGRIEGLVAAGMPKEHLVRLSAALFAAGKTARRAGAPARQLADWCRDCLNKHPAGVEPLISLGMPTDMMVTLSNELADLGWCAEACSVPDSFRELAVEFVLAGRAAEQVASGDRSATARKFGEGVGSLIELGRQLRSTPVRK
jgi:hypothetical protein